MTMPLTDKHADRCSWSVGIDQFSAGGTGVSVTLTGSQWQSVTLLFDPDSARVLAKMISDLADRIDGTAK